MEAISLVAQAATSVYKLCSNTKTNPSQARALGEEWRSMSTIISNAAPSLGPSHRAPLLALVQLGEETQAFPLSG